MPDDDAMRLFAAVVPPEGVRQELFDIVRAVNPGTPELDAVSVQDMRLPVSSFGNVAKNDADSLLHVLRAAASRWPRPRLWFNGSAALEFPGDESIWARVAGDVDGLLEVGRGVPVAVQPLGFLVDRRKFRTWLSVGTITDHTTAPYLERLTAALDGFTSAPWTLESLTVFRRVPVKGEQEEEDVVLEELPLREEAA